MRNVLDILEIAGLLYELVLEEHDVAVVMQSFTLVTASLLALVTCENDLLIDVMLAIRFGGFGRDLWYCILFINRGRGTLANLLIALLLLLICNSLQLVRTTSLKSLQILWFNRGNLIIRIHLIFSKNLKRDNDIYFY